jgi:hypothetical protein
MTLPIDPRSPPTDVRVPSRAMSEGHKTEATQPRDVDALLRKQDWAPRVGRVAAGAACPAAG